jgi:hypothetical protein
MASACFTTETMDLEPVSSLSARDIERELDRMKDTLTLIEVKRKLLSAPINGRTALQLVEAIMEIQDRAKNRPSSP